eukprot:COSAG05_NODE_4548_length_1468_cov_158.428780_1_plen_45_part_00
MEWNFDNMGTEEDPTSLRTGKESKELRVDETTEVSEQEHQVSKL